MIGFLDPRSKVGGVIIKTSDLGFGPPKKTLRVFLTSLLTTMSFSRKRSFGTQGGVPKTATRMVGGRKLTYRPTAPLSGSYRARLAASAGELNFKDTSLASQSFSSTPVLLLLNGMAQGTTASTRIGRRINIKSIQWMFDTESSTTSVWNGFRYMIIQDTQANAATPAFTDIYDVAQPTTFRNVSNMPRFKVLFDSKEVLSVGPTPGAGGVPGSDTIATVHQGYLKVNIPVQFNVGVAGTVADIQTNALYFVMIGNSAFSTLTDVQIYNGQVRIRYSD